MLLTISDSDKFCALLKSEYDAIGVFSFFAHYEDLAKCVDIDTDLIDTVIIDGISAQAESTELCRVLKAFQSELRIGTVLKSSKAINAKFIQIKHADAELFYPFSHDQFLSFYKKLCAYEEKGVNNIKLSISSDRRNTYLLGYKLSLTRTEHKILLLLASNQDNAFSASCISRLIAPFQSSSMSANNIAVHVCAINKKASFITGRRLILNTHKNGYTLTDEI